MSRLYIVMRNDLASLNPGKAMAQASHASTQFLSEYYKLLGNNKISKDEKVLVENWLSESDAGFGTCVVLEGSRKQSEELFESILLDNDICKGDCEKPISFMQGVVCDNTYPFMVQRELWDLLEEYDDSIGGKFLDSFKKVNDIVIDRLDGNEYGYKSTRNEITCYWYFIEDERIDYFKDSCDKFGIVLHK